MGSKACRARSVRALSLLRWPHAAVSQEFFLTLTRAEGGNIKQFTFTKDGKMSAMDADLMVVLAESTDDKARSRFVLF